MCDRVESLLAVQTAALLLPSIPEVAEGIHHQIVPERTTLGMKVRGILDETEERVRGGIDDEVGIRESGKLARQRRDQWIEEKRYQIGGGIWLTGDESLVYPIDLLH